MRFQTYKTFVSHACIVVLSWISAETDRTEPSVLGSKTIGLAQSLWDSSTTPISYIASNSDWTTFFLCAGNRHSQLRITTPGSISIWCWMRLVRPDRGENTSANSACNLATSVSWEGERWSPPGARVSEWFLVFSSGPKSSSPLTAIASITGSTSPHFFRRLRW